ncbi:MAG: Glu/Leu/Phe/Val dehydrogenase [Candidatus Woesearchaeota archaeon]
MVDYDEFGPEKILTVYDSQSGMKGFVVIDNTVLGPGKGGIRLTPSVTVDETARLARVMTWKCSIAGLPFGGAKSGIIAYDHNMLRQTKEQIIKAFSKAIKPVCPYLYVAAPDMNTAEQEMAWFADANGSLKSCTGKPRSMAGLPHELGSTGFGVFHSVRVAAPFASLDLLGSTVAIEGFGNVGWFAAMHLASYGATIVSVSDSKGVVYDKAGLDFDSLAKVKKDTGSVINYMTASKSGYNSILDVPADILITAAVPDLIKQADVSRLKFKLIVEGSNIPMGNYVEEALHKKGVLVVPDFVANAGGVISSYVEYKGGSDKEMFELVEKKVSSNTKTVLELAASKAFLPRQAAMQIAKERVLAKR